MSEWNEAIEAAAKIVEGERYKERYRKWPVVSVEGNMAEDSEVVRFSSALAKAIRSLSRPLSGESVGHGDYTGLVKAAQDFVAKVDRGEARSVKSYNDFRAGLAQVGALDQSSQAETKP